jgi:DNA-binding NarL/FixJ family response regulator
VAAESLPISEGNVSRVRTLLVDDNDDFLDGLSAWLDHDPKLEIVGRAHSGSEALERVAQLRPDLVLMDVSMAEINGFEAARRIKSETGAPAVILMTFHDSHAARLEAWAAGADSFLAKSEITERLTVLIDDLIRQRDRESEEAAAVARGTVGKKSKSFAKVSETRKPSKQGLPRDLDDPSSG